MGVRVPIRYASNMSLTASQIKYLKGLAHHRKPVVTVGSAGLTAAVLREIHVALEAHELLKIKLPALERDARQTLFDRICAESHAEPVQQIGRMAVIYQRADKARIQLPA
jgi:RNA-binding protein